MKPPNHDRVVYPSNGFVTHANSFGQPDLVQFERDAVHHIVFRGKRIPESGSEKEGKIAIEDVKQMLGNHSNDLRCV